MHGNFKTVTIGAVALLLVGGVATAAEEGWSNVAEVSLVAVSGNSESTSFGLKYDVERTWENAAWITRAGAINVETTNQAGVGVGTSVTDFTRAETTETTAEAYFLNSRYEQDLSQKLFWYGGLGWDRNEPSGIKNRMIASAGLGNVWIDTDDVRFKTSYGLTFTDQEDVAPVPGVDDTFAGVRFDWDYSNKLTATTAYTNVLVVDMNLDETSDWRANMAQGLSVAMSDNLSLKVGLQWLYDAEPAFELLPIVDVNGDPVLVGGIGPDQVKAPVELDDLDQIFTASLVVNF